MRYRQQIEVILQIAMKYNFDSKGSTTASTNEVLLPYFLIIFFTVPSAYRTMQIPGVGAARRVPSKE